MRPHPGKLHRWHLPGGNWGACVLEQSQGLACVLVGSPLNCFDQEDLLDSAGRKELSVDSKSIHRYYPLDISFLYSWYLITYYISFSVCKLIHMQKRWTLLLLRYSQHHNSGRVLKIKFEGLR